MKQKTLLFILFLLSTLISNAQTDLTGATVTLTPTSFDYDGTAHEPKVSGIRKGTKRYNSLKEGVDYDITYTDNVNVGTATATLTFKGNYTGVVTKNFEITPINLIGEVSIEVAGGIMVYDGNPKTPGIKDPIYYNGTLLIEGIDYDITYSNNTEAGTARLTVNFKGIYSGSVYKTFVIYSNDDIFVNENNIPDENFRNYLLSQSYASDGVITETEITDIKIIDVRNNNIRNLQGIERFKALTKLYCSNNQINSLDVSKNTALEKLDCSGNQLSSLDVSKNTVLVELNCSGNQLSSLDVSTDTVLIKLNCSDNRLSSLDVSKNTALETLNCSGNQIAEIEVFKNVVLKSLSCGSNKLQSIDISSNTTLRELDCSNNQLKSINVSQNTALSNLYCKNNQLTSLDLSNNTVLAGLDCSNNKLTSVDISKDNALKILDCYCNQIKGNALTKLIDLLPNVNDCSIHVEAFIYSLTY